MEFGEETGLSPIEMLRGGLLISRLENEGGDCVRTASRTGELFLRNWRGENLGRLLRRKTAGGEEGVPGGGSLGSRI